MHAAALEASLLQQVTVVYAGQTLAIHVAKVRVDVRHCHPHRLTSLVLPHQSVVVRLLVPTALNEAGCGRLTPLAEVSIMPKLRAAAAATQGSPTHRMTTLGATLTSHVHLVPQQTTKSQSQLQFAFCQPQWRHAL